MLIDLLVEGLDHCAHCVLGDVLSGSRFVPIQCACLTTKSNINIVSCFLVAFQRRKSILVNVFCFQLKTNKSDVLLVLAVEFRRRKAFW